MLYYPFPAVRWNILAMSSYINWKISDNVPQNDDQLDPNPEFRSVSLWITHIERNEMYWRNDWWIKMTSMGRKKWVMSKWQDPFSWMMLQHDDPVLFQKKLRTNRNQNLYFLWNNIEIMAFVTIMSTKWIQFKYLTFNISEPWFSVECFITSSNRTKAVLQ